MTKSLQDQLLGAGLIDKKKAKKISKQASKDANQKRRAKDAPPSELHENIERQRREKHARDLELNNQRKKASDKKAVLAQVTQLIQHYRVAHRQGDMDFNFKHNNTVKKLALNKDTFEKVSCGTLSVVCLNDTYDVVPRPVAEKIREREPSIVLVDNYGNQSVDEKQSDDDYYAEFEIPDDLMW